LNRMDDGHIGLGVIGCGGFGLFALQQFAQVPGVRLIGMAATHRPASLAAASRFGIENTDDVGAFLASRDLDVVYIATPPFLHHSQAMAALEAGKHVIVEKPLALTVAQADELVAIARRRDRLLVANLMQRYNPLFAAVRQLVEARTLGEVLHGSFENYASDENLPADHWFWDRLKSGGIFVEHGVHFFDLFAGWLGSGTVEAAQVGVRPGTAIEEHVHATVRYGDAALVNFYHGFHQAGRMDRQELRLVFERGDVTLYDWVPTRARIHALVDERQTRELCDLFPGARLDVAASYGGTDRACRGRGKAIDAYQVIDLSVGDGTAKSPLYGELLRAMMQDQVSWIRDRTHPRVVTEANGRDSLAVACAADELARRTGADR
ncbi:MAG TPA: Gfo/Idh/MocA family oxidoreductase, partial [Urbifossiella sp.]|nr:Gfo/Idh/MocA family oxidoreductase [Urbifossiella sp.]